TNDAVSTYSIWGSPSGIVTVNSGSVMVVAVVAGTVVSTSSSCAASTVQVRVICSPGAACVRPPGTVSSVTADVTTSAVVTLKSASRPPTVTVTVTVAPGSSLAVTLTAKLSPSDTCVALPCTAPPTRSVPPAVTAAPTGWLIPLMVTGLRLTTSPGSASVAGGKANGKGVFEAGGCTLRSPPKRRRR